MKKVNVHSTSVNNADEMISCIIMQFRGIQKNMFISTVTLGASAISVRLK